MECPSLNAIDCRCKINTLRMIHGADATFYPKAGCFKMGRTLYNARLFHDSLGEHCWEMFITNTGNACHRGVVQCRPQKIYFASMHITDGGISLVFPVERTTAVCIWRIQRAIRNFLNHKLQTRRLAVVMGIHHRLGCQSSMACLPADVLQKTLCDV